MTGTGGRLGPWAPLSISELARVLAPARFPWWVAGGYPSSCSSAAPSGRTATSTSRCSDATSTRFSACSLAGAGSCMLPPVAGCVPGTWVSGWRLKSATTVCGAGRHHRRLAGGRGDGHPSRPSLAGAAARQRESVRFWIGAHLTPPGGRHRSESPDGGAVDCGRLVPPDAPSGKHRHGLGSRAATRAGGSEEPVRRASR